MSSISSRGVVEIVYICLYQLKRREFIMQKFKSEYIFLCVRFICRRIKLCSSLLALWCKWVGGFMSITSPIRIMFQPIKNNGMMLLLYFDREKLPFIFRCCYGLLLFPYFNSD